MSTKTIREAAQRLIDANFQIQSQILFDRLSELRAALAEPPEHEFKQADWSHVFAAFVDGAREARANPGAADADFKRAADGYTKRVHEEVDPETERRLRENDWPAPLPHEDGVLTDAQIDEIVKATLETVGLVFSEPWAPWFRAIEARLLAGQQTP